MMIRTRREAIDLHRTFAITDASRGDAIKPEDLKKSMESYLYNAVPFLKKDMEQEDQRMVDEMRSWTRKGPLMVSSVKMPQVQSRLMQRAK